MVVRSCEVQVTEEPKERSSAECQTDKEEEEEPALKETCEFGISVQLETEAEKALTGKISEGVAKIKTLEDEASDLKSRAEAAEKTAEEAGALNKTLEELEMKVEEKRKRLQDFYLPEVTVAVSALDESRVNARDLSLLREGRKKEEDTLAKFKEMNAKRKEAENNLKDALKSLEAKEKERELLEKEKESLARGKEAASARHAEQEAKAAEKTMELERRLNEAKSSGSGEKAELKTKLKEKEAMLLESVGKLEREKTAKKQLEEKNAAIESKLREAEAELNTALNGRDRTRKENASLASRLREAEEAAKEGDQKLTRLEASLVKVTQERNASEERAKEERAEVARLQGASQTLQRKVADLEQDVSRAEVSALGREATWTVKEQQLEKKVAEMKEDRDKALTEARIKSAINEQMQTMQKNLREKLKVATRQDQSSSSSAGGGGAHAESKEQALKMVDLRSSLEREQKAKKALEAEKEAKKEEMDQMEKDLKEAREKVAEARKETAEVQKKARELEKLKKETDDKVTEMEIQIKQAIASTKEAKQRMDEQLEDIKRGQAERQAIKEREADFRKRLEAKEAETSASIDSLNGLHRRELAQEKRQRQLADERLREALEKGEAAEKEVKAKEQRIQALVSQREQQRRSGEDAQAAKESLFSLLEDFAETLAEMGDDAVAKAEPLTRYRIGILHKVSSFCELAYRVASCMSYLPRRFRWTCVGADIFVAYLSHES